MEKAKAKERATRVPHETDRSGCVVCGQYGAVVESGIATTGDSPRWHEACAQARPDVIAKVKARA